MSRENMKERMQKSLSGLRAIRMNMIIMSIILCITLSGLKILFEMEAGNSKVTIEPVFFTMAILGIIPPPIVIISFADFLNKLLIAMNNNHGRGHEYE